MDIRRLLRQPCVPLSLRPGDRLDRPGFSLVVDAPWGVLEAEFTRAPSKTGTQILLRGASAALWLRHPDRTALLGTLTVPVRHLSDDRLFATAVPDANTAARWLDAALLYALGPEAEACADLLRRLTQGVLLRENASAGILRPFLPSGPRVILLRFGASYRHVAIFRGAVRQKVAPPDLAPLARRAHAVFPAFVPALHSEEFGDFPVQAPEGRSAHARLSFRADLVRDAARLGYDLEPWNF